MLFTATNIFIAGTSISCFGAILIVLACFKMKKNKMNAAQSTQLSQTPSRTFDDNKSITIHLIIIITSFIVPRFGKIIESETYIHGVFSLSNIISIFAIILLIALFILRTKVALLLESFKKLDKQEVVTPEKYLLGLGAIVFASGFIVLTAI